MDTFALIVGNARSGTTIVGSIVDSHPNMLCANESGASAVFWRGRDRAQIIAEIEENSARNAAEGRQSSGYRYAIPTPYKGEIGVYADKCFNPALLLLAGDRGLIDRLSDTMQCPVTLVHCVRNPFDVIATMHKRSGAALEDRTRWFFMHADAAMNLLDRGVLPFVIRHESLVAEPREVSRLMFRYLGQDTDDAHLDRIASVVSTTPKRSRDTVKWAPALIELIEQRLAGYPFLAGYKFS